MTTTHHGLSASQRAALLDALACRYQDLHLVYSGRATTRVLIDRGLAVREPGPGLGHRTVLTEQGEELAVRLRDQARPR